jgi:hypothetical protein
MLLFYNCMLLGKGRCPSSHGCQDFCFAIPVKPGFTCGCRDGFSVGKDGKVCEPVKDYISPLSCKPGEFKCKKFPRCIPERYSDQVILA